MAAHYARSQMADQTPMAEDCRRIVGYLHGEVDAPYMSETKLITETRDQFLQHLDELADQLSESTKMPESAENPLREQFFAYVNRAGYKAGKVNAALALNLGMNSERIGIADVEFAEGMHAQIDSVYTAMYSAYAEMIEREQERFR